MSIDTTQVQKIDEALNLKELKLPEKPRVTSLRWEDYQDWSGEESLQIWVILSDETTDEELTGEAAHAIKWAVRDRLEAAGIRLFPYFRFALESDPHDAPGDDCVATS